MNDFTKDELCMISRAIINLEKIDDKNSIEFNLYLKIQKMIGNENYPTINESIENGKKMSKEVFELLYEGNKRLEEIIRLLEKSYK